jgi:L-aminopeptidase/D-esterase-like protein
MDRRNLLKGAGLLAAVGAAPVAAQPAQLRSDGRTGPRNLITDVAGLTVGIANDPQTRTGVTVILADKLSIAAVDVRGGGPGTRETDALDAYNLVHAANAIVLSGGSSYGLAAADGVAAYLGAHGIGFSGMARKPGVPVSPIVSAAILYDLANGGNKDWGLEPPYRSLGIKAVQAAGADFPLGTSGAGYGAMSGGLKGGLGSASTVTSENYTVGAIVAVNSMGSTVAPDTRYFWASPYEIGHEFGGLPPQALFAGPEQWGFTRKPAERMNTTIACVATDVALTADEMKRVAIMAQDGLSRAIRPVHTPFDGDVLFAISTGRIEPIEPRELATLRVGTVAADTLARSVARGVYEATSPPGANVKTWKSLAS